MSATTSIRVYNTLSKSKEPFQPIRPGKVGMYLCGPTVYKPSHIGHMVGPVIFDAIKRYLVYNGLDVTWVVNITDIDDKLIAESVRRGIPMSEVAAEMTEDYRANLAALDVTGADRFPKATEHIAEIIDFTKALVQKGFAYSADGDVYFDVGQDPEYGKLSHRSLEAIQGEGGEAGERKKNSADFALWKRAKEGEPSWDSPWGPGRPGWHIECSAMSRAILGESFDIHGGGLDLVFPHHENEIAQSECLHGQPMARYWMHNGLMQASSEVGKLGGRNTRATTAAESAADPAADVASDPAAVAAKISKSTGARPFRELLAEHEAETIRFFLLSTHYRRPIDFSDQRLREVHTGMEAFYRFFKRLERITGESFYRLAAPANRAAGESSVPPGDALAKDVATRRANFLDAMDDDFNTGGAIGELYELLRLLNKHCDLAGLDEPGKANAPAVAALRAGATTLRELVGVLGVFLKPPGDKSSASDDGFAADLMSLVIELRASARKNKDFATADKIRETLTRLGVTLEDRASGTEWTRK